jgi:hypothetical protein
MSIIKEEQPFVRSKGWAEITELKEQTEEIESSLVALEAVVAKLLALQK